MSSGNKNESSKHSIHSSRPQLPSSISSSRESKPDILHFPLLQDIVGETRQTSDSSDLNQEIQDSDDDDYQYTYEEKEERKPINTLCFLPPIPEDGGPIPSLSLPHPFMLMMEEAKVNKQGQHKRRQEPIGNQKKIGDSTSHSEILSSHSKKPQEVKTNVDQNGIKGHFNRSQSLAPASSKKSISFFAKDNNCSDNVRKSDFQTKSSRSKSTVTWSDNFNKMEENNNKNQQKRKSTSGRSRRNTLFTFDRRKSVLVTFFGEGQSYRRYSEDLKPRVVVDRDSDDDEDEKEETLRVIFYQVFIPFLISGFDNVGAGMILDHVQYWSVFKTIPELFILVASFLGLKGNLEMTLAARLATLANMGQLDKERGQRWKIALGNLVLVQGQAIVVAILAALIAIVVNFFKEPDFDLDDCLLLLMTGLTTASLTGLAMASLMVCATIVARNLGINPDNVSALIASIMGDISAVALLAFSAKFFYEGKEYLVFVGPIVIVFYLLLLPVLLRIARSNEFTKDVVGIGWLPIITAMIISSFAGFVFDIAVGFFDTIAVVQPIVNGVGGNLIAVQASRISTYFHLRSPLGELPCEEESKVYESEIQSDQLIEKTYRKTCPTPFTAFVGNRK